MRRTIIALFALFFLLSAALADEYAFRFEGGAAVVNEIGISVIASGIYKTIYILHAEDGSVAGYAAGTDVDGLIRYALLSPTGKKLTEFMYDSIVPAGDSFVCSTGGVYKVVSAEGIEEAETYSAIAYAGDGAYLTLSGNINDEIADLLTLRAKNGIKWQLGIRTLYGLGAFSDDLMPLCDGGSVSFGYIGRDGKWKIPPQFKYAGDFEEGFAIVSMQTGYGVIDLSGTFIIDPNRDFVERSGKRIITRKDGVLALYHLQAEGLFPVYERYIGAASPRLSGASVILYDDTGVSVLDDYGAVRFTASPAASIHEAVGCFIVRDGDWAEASTYLTDLAGVQLSAKYNTIRLLEGEGESALYAYGVMAADSYDMKFGMMRGDGKIVAEPMYDEIARVGPNLICAVTAEAAVLLDGMGNFLSNIE